MLRKDSTAELHRKLPAIGWKENYLSIRKYNAKMCTIVHNRQVRSIPRLQVRLSIPQVINEKKGACFSSTYTKMKKKV